MAVTLIENFRALLYTPFYASFALRAYEAEGVDVQMKASPHMTQTLQELASGTGQVSWGGPLRVMGFLDKDPKLGFVAFCEIIGRDPFFLIGRTARPDFRVQDLHGNRFAVTTEVPTPWICLKHDLRLAGVDPASIELAPERTMDENSAALHAGKLDVIQVFQPHARKLLDEGCHLWYASADRGPTAYTTFNTTRRFLEENPDTALRMTRAMHRTQKWIFSHEGAELAEVVASYFPGLPRPLAAAAFEDYKRFGVWNQQPVPQRAGMEWLRDALLANGDIRTRFTYEDLVDTRFAEQVVRENPASL